MMYGLNIPEKSEFDLISLGALVHRLDPGIVPFRKATNFDAAIPRFARSAAMTAREPPEVLIAMNAPSNQQQRKRQPELLCQGCCACNYSCRAF